MAFTTNTINRSADRLSTRLGEAIDQIHDHRLSVRGGGELRFCESEVRINPNARPVKIPGSWA